MGVDPVAEAYRVAREVAHSRAPGPWDWDERESIAGLAVAELLAQGRPLTGGLVTHTVRRRLVDELRRRLGKRGQKPQFAPLEPWQHPPTVESPSVWPWVDEVLPEPHRSTCRRLADGWSQADIARADGVTEGAVSHRLTTIRQQLEDQ